MSRRWRNSIFIAAILVAVLLIFLDQSRDAQRPQQNSTSKTETQSHDLEKYHAKTFTVVNVVDGDTIDIDIADGTRDTTRIRLWGVDTPETKKPGGKIMYFGPEASAFVKKTVLGKRICVYLHKEKKNRGKYGRLLAYVQLEDSSFLNELLISEGYGYADLRFRHSLYYKYQQLEAAARSQKIGLWKDVTREQLPKWLQKEKPKLLQGK